MSIDFVSAAHLPFPPPGRRNDFMLIKASHDSSPLEGREKTTAPRRRHCLSSAHFRRLLSARNKGMIVSSSPPSSSSTQCFSLSVEAASSLTAARIVFRVAVTITIICDKQFSSALYRDLGFGSRTTTAYHSAINGLVNRFHHQVEASTTANSGVRWAILLGIGSTLRKDIGYSPLESLFATILTFLVLF
uniref:Uncharacterized protein n=1 Tax=Echinococcus canadensis TaxID=519352 RepID=A0A915EWT8_9CEST